MVGLLDHLTSQNCSLTLRRLDLFQFLPFWRALIVHVDWVIGLTAVTFNANFVLFAHTTVPILLVTILMLHELPPLDVTFHLGQAASLDQGLLL